ncbi:hypothetical protein [Noviherbaspirillum sp. UKPF54]|uniref:hypothetical protein n=1 Tax=Noviherbaspirillum sp. UKPF54 TaxID=2601898 RepID=UPI0011B139E4|nr:hypothetical protein [Noviherbaspirillum sp. UKPF54]QDZ29869.1 hypothetical protein FAY22_19010 [Noviherbaspirillum sp. UKPF54]
MPGSPVRLAPLRIAGIAAAIAIMSGCAGPKYTVDDGSPVDAQLLAAIRTYGQGHQATRAAVVKTAQLNDKDCDKQWELPFVVATSYDLPREKKIAWVRGLAVDERLSVIAAAPESGLAVGDKIEEVHGYKRENTQKMLVELIDRRDSGRPFELKLSDMRVVKIAPVEVCRGHFQIAAPEGGPAQDYHWLQSTHPLSAFSPKLTPDEALWAVLWTQGLSEEAGARMKVYHYGLKAVKTGMTIASIASVVGSVGAAAQAANAAANAAANSAASAAGNAAAQAAAQAAAKALAQQVADDARQSAINAAQKLLRQQAQDIAINSVKAAAIFKDSLSGISWVAGTGFYMADKWAFDRMEALGADPMAAFTLHYKLASGSLSQNAFVFDEERLKLISEMAQKKGLAEKVKLALSGADPDAPPAVAEALADSGTTELRPLDDAPAAQEPEAGAAEHADAPPPAQPVALPAEDSVPPMTAAGS